MAMLNSSSMTTGIQLSRDDLPNKILMSNDDFSKNLQGQIVALISKIVASLIAIVASSISSEIPMQGLNNERYALVSIDRLRPFHAGLIKTIFLPYIKPAL